MDAEGSSRRKRPRIELGLDGEQLELLVDGVAYSTFHAERPWSGYVWDALAATVLLARKEAPSVLMLGCGGGTALRLMRRLRPAARLTTVELDPRVLRVARKRFGLELAGAEVFEGDGVAWLSASRRRFDLIIDDMFGAGETGLLRPVSDEEAHLRSIARRLLPGGVAVTNSTCDEDPPGLERAVRQAHRSAFPHQLAIEPPLGFNVVVASSSLRLDSRALRQPRGVDDPVDREALAALRLRRF